MIKRRRPHPKSASESETRPSPSEANNKEAKNDFQDLPTARRMNKLSSDELQAGPPAAPVMYKPEERISAPDPER